MSKQTASLTHARSGPVKTHGQRNVSNKSYQSSKNSSDPLQSTNHETTASRPSSKRFRVQSNESANSSANLDSSTDDFSQLSILLDNLTKNEEGTRKVLNVILGKPAIKHCIAEHFATEFTSLKSEINDLKTRMDEMEQYSRRNCLKFTGITEEGDAENTDEMVLRVINRIILPNNDPPYELCNISRTHRVGPPRRDGKPRDIIVKFLSYRDRALVYNNKKNLKSYNANPSNRSRIFINEALTRTRNQLFFKTRKLAAAKQIDSVWTYDGRIIIKTNNKKRISLTNEADFDQLLETLNVNPLSLQSDDNTDP